MDFSPIEKYLTVAGGLTADQAKRYSRSIYDAYKLAIAAGLPTANPIGPKTDYEKTVSFVAGKVIIPRPTVEMFFRALYDSVKQGKNKSEDLFIGTAQAVKEQKRDDLKKSFGLDTIGKIFPAVVGTVAIASIAVIVFKMKKSH